MSKNINELTSFFHPRSIAIIGASEVMGGFGARFLNSNLKFGFRGKMYAVNHKGEEVLGHKIHRSVLDIPDPVDLAVFCVGGRFVPGILEECLKKGIKSAVVLSSGFSELGDEGRALEQELVDIAEKGIRIMGPNCFGVYCPSGTITTIPGENFPKEQGGVALIAQSGQFSEMIVIRSIGEGIRFSKVVSYGNACNINEYHLLEYLAQDDETKIITSYLEGVKEGRRFFDVARRLAGKKPLAIWKVGLTRTGSAAASSHTGSMAGERSIWDAFFRQTHAIELKTLEELIDVSVGFSCLPNGCGSRIALISGGGGGAVISGDACELAGLSMPPLSAEIEDKIRAVLPAIGTAIKNPMDIGSPHPPIDVLTTTLEALGSFHEVDVIVMRRLFFSGKVCRLLAGNAAYSDEDQQSLIELPVKIKEKYGKPVVIVMPEELTSIDAMELEEARRRLRDYFFAHGIPVFESEQRAFTTLSHMAGFNSRIGKEYVPDDAIQADERETNIKSSLAKILQETSSPILGEIECKQILKEAGVDVIEAVLAGSKDEALKISKSLGYPVAMKIVSPQITHKSDAGGVKLGIRNEDEAGKAYDQILKNVKENNPGAVVHGVSVQKMADPGVEIVMGMIKDPQFGPMLMFGLGGIFVEIIKDVSFRIVPLTREDAREMIREIRGYRLLEGYRGQAPVDVSYLEELLLRISRFVDKNPEILEMDINPIMAYEKGAVAVDARIVIET